MEQIKGPLSILIVGDSHGNWRFFNQVIDIAIDNEIDLVIQVGDFGFWPEKRDEAMRPFPDPVDGFAALVNRRARNNSLPVWVVRGNHDWRVEAELYPGNMDLTPGLHYIRDGSRVKLSEAIFLFTGGAVSVDQQARTEGLSWWPDEIVSMADILSSIEGGVCDVWITHDSVTIPPMKRPLSFGPKVDMEVSIQKQRMEAIFNQVRPRLHIHGHWHCRYTAPTHYGNVIGVSCESQDALMLLTIDEHGKVEVGA